MDWQGSAPPLLPDTAPPRVRPSWYCAPLRATRRRRRRHTGAARRLPAEPGAPPCEPATSVRALSTWGQEYQPRCPMCLPEMATLYTQRPRSARNTCLFQHRLASKAARSARVSARASMRSAGSAQANVRSAGGTAADAGRHRSNPDRSTAGVRGARKSRSECRVQ